ncbi:MAG: cryptochrome/photolyase family protein, partial [Cyanobacteria bacterium P01_H01_bin.15]
MKTPKVRWFEPDEITQSAITDVKQLLGRGYGEIEPFRWGVTGVQASQAF